MTDDLAQTTKNKSFIVKRESSRVKNRLDLKYAPSLILHHSYFTTAIKLLHKDIGLVSSYKKYFRGEKAFHVTKLKVF